MPTSAAKKKLVARPRTKAGEGSLVDLNRAAIRRAHKVVERNAALVKIYERLLKVVAETTREEASRRYDIGKLVRQVRDDEEKYGKRSVEALAMLLRFDKSTLHDYANVATTWDDKEFKALLKKKTALGLGLRFSHLVVLAQVDDGRGRNALITRALAQNLTVRQLAEIVRAGAAADGDAAASEPSAPTPADVIRRVSLRWETAADEIDRDTRELVQLASTQRTPEVLALVQAAADRQRALAVKATACADQLVALANAESPS